jgi:hypothetical protein
MHRYHNGSAWQSWEDLGGAINYQPAAVSDRAGHIYVFVQGNGDRLQYIKYGPPLIKVADTGVTLGSAS